MNLDSLLAPPIHPMIVHLPLALAVLLPLVSLTAIVAIGRGARARPTWLVTVACTVLLLGGAKLAESTGEEEHEVVDKVVEHDVIHEHEEAGELMTYLAAGALATALLGLLDSSIGRLARGATVLVAVAGAGAAVRTGHLGAAIVYRHGGAAVWQDSTTGVDAGRAATPVGAGAAGASPTAAPADGNAPAGTDSAPADDHDHGDHDHA